MNKTILSIVFCLFSIVFFGQDTTVEFKRVEDFKKGVVRIETSPEYFSEGLNYSLVKEIKTENPNMISYSLKITMNNAFKKTLNSELKTDIEFGNGDFVSDRETKENEGWFNGTFTIPFKNIQRPKDYGIIHFIIKGEIVKIYCIDEANNIKLKNNIAQLISIPIQT
jgi:hypothetical protein